MKRFLGSLICLCVFTPFFATPAMAQGWKMPDFNPFDRKEPQRVRTTIGDEMPARSGWSLPRPKLPKLAMPQLRMPALPKPKLPEMRLPRLSMPGSRKMPGSQPSAWNRFNDGTKQFFTKTKDVLTPWDNGSDKGKPKKTFFSSWLPKKEEPKPIQSVDDFLALPKVPY